MSSKGKAGRSIAMVWYSIDKFSVVLYSKGKAWRGRAKARSRKVKFSKGLAKARRSGVTFSKGNAERSLAQ